MTKTFLQLFLLPLLLVLPACHTTKVSPSTTVRFAPRLNATGTLPPPQLPQKLRREQLLTATVGNSTHSLHVLLEADGNTVTLVGLSPLGIRLFKGTYDNTGISTQQFAPLGKLPPVQQVLADIMLAYWPIEAWHPHLPKNWTLTDTIITTNNTPARATPGSNVAQAAKPAPSPTQTTTHLPPPLGAAAPPASTRGTAADESYSLVASRYSLVNDGNAVVRQLRDNNDTLITEITYDPQTRDPVQIRQLAFNYQINITTLETE